jgi:hypothetical protein
MSVGYSRRTSFSPGAMASQLAASSSCRWASTPSFWRPGSTPISNDWSESTSSSVIVSASPLGLRTTHTALPSSPTPSVSVLGAFIQLSGL